MANKNMKWPLVTFMKIRETQNLIMRKHKHEQKTRKKN